MSQGLRSKGIPTKAGLPPATRKQRKPEQAKSTMTQPVDKEEYSSSELMKAIIQGNELSKNISEQVVDLDNKIGALTTRVEQVEQRVSDGEDRANIFEHRLKSMEKEIKVLCEKNTEMETRSRKFNLKVVGLKEGREGSDATAFSETLFFTLFGSCVPERIELQVAHRSPGRQEAAVHSSVGKPAARTVCVRFLQLQDKIKVQRQAQEKGSLTFENTRIRVYPDYAQEIQKKRNEYNDIRYGNTTSDMKFSTQQNVI